MYYPPETSIIPQTQDVRKAAVDLSGFNAQRHAEAVSRPMTVELADHAREHLALARNAATTLADLRDRLLGALPPNGANDAAQREPNSFAERGAGARGPTGGRTGGEAVGRP